MKNIKNKNPGFTLIETIIAIFLLMMTITALMELVSKTLIATRGQRLDSTAHYLAQEGIEYLRNNRDSALNSGATWADYTQMGVCSLTVGTTNTVSICPCIYPSSNTTGSCTVDPITDVVAVCPAGGCPALIKIEPISYKEVLCTPGFGCPGTNKTLGTTTFVRTIRLTPATNPNELFADITVTWVDTGGVNRSKVIRTSLLNW